MLNGKLAIITGCRSGIGNSVLKIFAQNKANIIACIRKEDKTFEDECKKLSKKYSVKITPSYFDLNDENSVKKEVGKMLLENDKIDILVNNAGEIETSAFLMTKMETFRKIFQVNFLVDQVLQIIQNIYYSFQIHYLIFLKVHQHLHHFLYIFLESVNYEIVNIKVKVSIQDQVIIYILIMLHVELYVYH